MQLAEGLDEVREVQRYAVLPLKLRPAVPHEHDEEQYQRHDDRDVAAVDELAEAGDEEHRLYRAEHDQHHQRKQLLRTDAPEVHRQQQRHRQHRHGYCKAVGRLHAAAGAEQQDDDYAAEHQHTVDGGDV